MTKLCYFDKDIRPIFQRFECCFHW